MTEASKGVFSNVVESIGGTPIIRLNSCVPNIDGHEFFAKVEYFNPGGSVKDRIALAIIEDAEKSGKIKPGGTLVEATSGNTGVGLAMVAAIKGYKCVFVMPEKISEEKRATLRAYGARVVITPTGVEPEDPRSHYAVAKKFVEITPNSYLTNQYHNPANSRVHYEVTGPEIWEQMDGRIDAFIGGIGTGGTLSGVGRYLKEKNPQIQIACADPIGSILHDLFYYKEVREKPASYFVEGIGEDMLPDNVHFQYMDEFFRVTDTEAFMKTREIAVKEGLLVGPSCGAALMGAIKLAQSGKLKKPSRILTLFPDSGRSYLSKAFNDEWMREKGMLENSAASLTVKDLLGARKSSKKMFVQVNASIREAAALMQENGLSQLAVFSDKALVGSIESSDLLFALASGKLRAEEPLLHLVRSSMPEVPSEMGLVELEKALVSNSQVMVKGTGELVSRADVAAFLSDRKA